MGFLISTEDKKC